MGVGGSPSSICVSGFFKQTFLMKGRAPTFGITPSGSPTANYINIYLWTFYFTNQVIVSYWHTCFVHSRSLFMSLWYIRVCILLRDQRCFLLYMLYITLKQSCHWWLTGIVFKLVICFITRHMCKYALNWERELYVFVYLFKFVDIIIIDTRERKD